MNEWIIKQLGRGWNITDCFPAFISESEQLAHLDDLIIKGLDTPGHFFPHTINSHINIFETVVFVMNIFSQNVKLRREKAMFFLRKVDFSELSHHEWTHQSFMLCGTDVMWWQQNGLACSGESLFYFTVTHVWELSDYIWLANTQHHECCFLSCCSTSHFSASILE